MSTAASSPGDRDVRDPARRVGAAVVRWTRQNEPGGRWRTWWFTADATADAIGPRVDGLLLAPGSPSELPVLESAVRRTSGIRSTGRGVALAFPANLREDATVRSDLAGVASPAPVVTPRTSGADPAPGSVAVTAVAVQLAETEQWAVVVDRDDTPNRPFDPAGPDGGVVFPAPDVVPALLRRAVHGPDSVRPADLPDPGTLLVRGWVARVIRASMAHGSASREVERALAAAPTIEQVRSATLEDVHELLVRGELPGPGPETVRWCGPLLGTRVAAGMWGRLPSLLAYADEHWEDLGARLATTTRGLLGADA